jgi:hypothetical protein
MLPAKFGSIWPSSFRGEDFLDEAIEELEENDSLLYVDDNDLVKYKHTEKDGHRVLIDLNQEYKPHHY